MKRKDKQQIISMAAPELVSHVRELEKQIKTIELDKFTKPMKNVRAITALRLKVAMMKTRLNEQTVTEVVKEK